MHASSRNAAASTLAAQAVREALKQPSARKREVENFEYNHTLYVLGEGTRSHGSLCSRRGDKVPWLRVGDGGREPAATCDF